MFKQFLLSTFALLLVSCEKEGVAIQNNTNENVSSTAVLVSSGAFTPTSGISVTGDAKIYIDNTIKKVVLKNFTISEGPDLKVYLSKSAAPEAFVNLGNLTSTTVYNIPQEVDLTLYKYVLIHCQQFNHLYAIAELK